MAHIDVTALFETNESTLATHNISGAKVLYLLSQGAGLSRVSWGEAQAAHGLGLAFCYQRGQFAAVFSSNIDLSQRAGEFLGCHLEATWTADAEEGWRFIESSLRAGRLVKMAGPEDCIIFGCGDVAEAAGRTIEARGVGGPSLRGLVGWEVLSQWIPQWVPLAGGGMYRVAETSTKPAPADAVCILARRVVEWQDQHPGVGRCGDAANYGISALELFLTDLLEPEFEIPPEYLNCFAINFQHNARWLIGAYLGEMATELSGPESMLVQKVAHQVDTSAGHLRHFVEEELGAARTTAAGRARIGACLGKAIEAENRVLEGMEKLAVH